MKKLILLFGLILCCASSALAQYSTTPIMLSLPMDGDTIEEDEPLFVWQTTLSNVENDPRLNLKLTVVQVEDEQTPTEAMIENQPVFVRQNLLSTSFNYSEIDHELVEGKWYAWQVVLYFNGVQVQQSEVWKFIKASPNEENQVFYTLKTKSDNSIIEFEGDELFFTTVEKGEFTLNATISGKKIETQNIQFSELHGTSENDGKSHSRREARYFRCDLESLNLKKGVYRIDWQSNTQLHFIVLIEKK